MNLRLQKIERGTRNISVHFSSTTAERPGVDTVYVRVFMDYEDEYEDDAALIRDAREKAIQKIRSLAAE